MLLCPPGAPFAARRRVAKNATLQVDPWKGPWGVGALGGPVGGALGDPWGAVGGPLGRPLGDPWGTLGDPWGTLKDSWVTIGGPLEDLTLEALRRPLGRPLWDPWSG